MYSRLETLLDSIYKECTFLMQITEGLTKDSDLGQSTDDIKTFRAICFGEQNIGEAVVQLGHLTQDRLFEIYPSVDWKAIKGMKNHIVHKYLDIDEAAIISTAIEDIPRLRTSVLTIKKDMANNRLNKLILYIKMAQGDNNFKIPSCKQISKTL